MVRSIKFCKTQGVLQKAEVLGSEILNPYNEVLNHYNSLNAKQTLRRFQIIDNEIAGLNPFICVNLQKVLPKNKRFATREDLEAGICFSELFLEDCIDFGIALETAWDSNYKQNDFIARNLAEQLKDRGIKLDRGKLILFSLFEDTPESENSSYGLVFKLADLSSREIKEKVMDLDRINWIYRRKRGISCAYFGWNSVWCCSDGNLGLFYPDTRAIVISAEGALTAD